jgi:general secretion pathway protein F
MAAIPQFRALGASVARAMPILGRILKSRDLAGWTRLVGFGLSNGLILLKALDLAKAGVADPNWRARLVQVERALRSGADVDEALAPNTPLSVVDLSVVRTGQRSGALGPMFLLLADNYEADVKDLVRRATALIEPIALAMVAGVVGTIAVALALALSSIYDTVG